MEHFTWDLSPEGICSGGNGVSCTTEDMLKVGNLFLNMGQWNGKQILTEEWCRMAIGLDKVYEGQGDYAFHWDRISMTETTRPRRIRPDRHSGARKLNMVVAGTGRHYEDECRI